MADYLTLTKVTEKVPVSQMTVRRAIKAGELAAFKIGGKLLIRPDDLDRWIESRRVVSSPMPSPKPMDPSSLMARAMKERNAA